MKVLLRLVVLCTMLAPPLVRAEDFREAQKRFPRVRQAYTSKEATVRAAFEAANVTWPPRGILLRVFKHEGQFELWGRNADGAHALVKTYPICEGSGGPGPKLERGDGQVPEGVYEIDRFNPTSNFHLSLGVNYPNAADRVRSKGRDPGGDIFVHGSCVTIGCVPLTDALIEEVYVAAVEARHAGQKRIPVHFFPGRLDDAAWAKLIEKHPSQETFWRQLKPIYDAFERTKRVSKHRVDAAGQYEL